MERVFLCIWYCYQGLAPIKVVRAVTFLFIYNDWFLVPERWSVQILFLFRRKFFVGLEKRTQFTNIYFLFSPLLVFLFTYKPIDLNMVILFWFGFFLKALDSHCYSILIIKKSIRGSNLFLKTLRDFSHFLLNKWQEKEMNRKLHSYSVKNRLL